MTRQTTTNASTRVAVTTSRLASPRGRPVVTVLATGAALAVWAVAAALTDGPQIVAAGTTQQVGPVAVVMTTLIASLAGWGLLALLERHGAHPRRSWTVVALVVLLASLAGPIGSGADPTSTTTLLLLHLAVGVVVITGLRRTTH